jgi:hypothetical protein
VFIFVQTENPQLKVVEPKTVDTVKDAEAHRHLQFVLNKHKDPQRYDIRKGPLKEAVGKVIEAARDNFLYR